MGTPSPVLGQLGAAPVVGGFELVESVVANTARSCVGGCSGGREPESRRAGGLGAATPEQGSWGLGEAPDGGRGKSQQHRQPMENKYMK